MMRRLSITALILLIGLVWSGSWVVVPSPAQAQTPDDDGWGDEEEGDDDGWDDEEEAPAEEAAPAPTPAPEEEEEEAEDDDGWGDESETPAPAETPAPSGDAPAEAPAQPAEAAPAPAQPAEAAPAPEPEPEPEPVAAPPPPKPEPLPTPPADLAPGAKLAFTAGALIDRGDFTAAEAKASLATVTPGGEAAGQVQLARLRLRQGRMREALQAARAAVSQEETNAPARLLLVRLMAAQGESVDAQVSVIERLSQRFPDDLGLAIALGETQIAAKRNAAAMRTARAVLKRAETSVTAMKILARAYYAGGNDATAESILERAITIEEDPEACHLMSQVFMKRKNVVQARVWLDRAIAADPHYIEALNNLGVAFIQMRDFPAALAVLPRVTRLAPGFGAAWLNLGIAQRGAKRFADAEKSWREVLRVQPRMSEAWFNIGVLYLENEMPGVAKEARFNQAIDAFNRYRHGARMTGEVDKSIDDYIAEATRLIDQEKKRKERALKKPKAGGDDDWGDDEGGGDEGGDDDWGDDEGGGDDGGGDDDWGDDEGGDDDW